ncbi:MAG: formate/nitrite transporter family protein [Rhodobacteraceae bacterium]|nr:formate/nitrite transporter family protein [Paracoccaceae bacterium]
MRHVPEAPKNQGARAPVSSGPDVGEAENLSSPEIYEVIRREGDDELRRPAVSLFWSGIAAGVLISLSVLGEAILHLHLPDTPARFVFENFGYCLGFVVVIMGRMQLFTENTITTVLPFLAEPSHRVAARVARLWTIVFGANVIGAFLAAAFYLIPDVLSADLLGAMIHVSEHAVSLDPMTAFLRGIPAGVLIAALVWMLPRGGSSKLALIVLFTWLIAASDLTHVVAGSVEVALLIIGGILSVPAGFGGFILPVLLGNILGGTAIFTALAWGQVHQEVP